MKKLHELPSIVRDGKVGVLVSPGFGAGFYTWGAPLEAIVNPTLIGLIEEDKIQEAVDFVETTYPNAFSGGVDDLEVRWIPIGTQFIINEYDGFESIQILGEINWLEA